MLEQDLSQLDHRSNESVMSVLTELPVPATFDNGVQSINIHDRYDTTNRKTGTDEEDIQQQQQ